MPIGTSSSFVAPRDDLREVGLQAISQGGFVGQLVLPPEPVSEITGVRHFHSPKNFMQGGRKVGSKSGGRAVGNRRSLVLDSVTFNCQLYEWEMDYTKFDQAKFKSLINFEMSSTMALTLEAQRGHEAAVYAKLTDTAVWTGSTNTLAVVEEWDDAANSVPVDDLVVGKQAIRNKSGQDPNFLLIGWYTYQKMCLSQQIRSKLGLANAGSTETALIPLPKLANLFDLENIYVSRATQDTANEGQAFSGAAMWNDEYAFLGRADSGPLEGSLPSLGKTFFYDGYAGILDVLQYSERGGKLNVISVESCTDEKILNTGCGFLFSNIKT